MRLSRGSGQRPDLIDESIAEADHRFDVPAGCAELAPEPAHVHVDRPRSTSRS
jgi:hypothetical protein